MSDRIQVDTGINKEFTIEDINAVTDEELLGLDEPARFTHGVEGIYAPKIVRMLYQAKNPMFVAEFLLSRFGLNPKSYDAAQNPTGIAETMPVQERGRLTLMRGILFALTGVPRSIMQALNINYRVKHVSPAVVQAIASSDEGRQNFYFANVQEFPEIQQSLEAIKK